MCCLALIAGFIGPRLAAVRLVDLRSDSLGSRFQLVDLAALGILVLPWTTLAYVLMWSVVGGVERLRSGSSWRSVLPIDIASYSARAAKSRYQSTAY